MSDFSGESRKAEYKYSQEAEVRAEATLYVMGHTMLNKTHRWPRGLRERGYVRRVSVTKSFFSVLGELKSRRE